VTVKRIFVKPLMGLVIRDPDSRFMKIPSEGKWVISSKYWIRREQEGSISISNGETNETKAELKVDSTEPRKYKKRTIKTEMNKGGE